MPAGEAKRLSYRPGEKRPESAPVEEGDHQFMLADFGKPGMKGWKAGKPGKFPYRMLKWIVIGTEDEVTGNEKTIRDVCSASPKAFFRVHDLASGCAYPNEMDLPHPTKPNSREVQDVLTGIDELLSYIKDNKIVMNGTIAHEEYKGRDQARIVSWLPPEEGGEAEASDDAEEETVEEEDIEETTDEESSDEEAEESDEAEASDEGGEEDAEYEEVEDEDGGEVTPASSTKRAATKKPVAVKHAKVVRLAKPAKKKVAGKRR